MLPIHSSSSEFGPHLHPDFAHGFLCATFFCGSMVFHTLFGLSKNFWMALATRFLLGSFNGMHGTVKANSELSTWLKEKIGFLFLICVISSFMCPDTLQHMKKTFSNACRYDVLGDVMSRASSNLAVVH
jgi:hypothetical protein